MKKYNHIIWDWNGTIVDDALLCFDIMRLELKKRYDKEIRFSDYRNKFKFPIKEFYEDLGFDFEIDSFEEVTMAFVTQYTARRKECQMQFGLPHIFERFIEAGIEHSLLSAYAENYLLEMVDFYKLRKFFKNIKGLSNDRAESKIEEGREIIGKISESSDKIVLIGDTNHDFEVASELGIDSIIVKNGHQSDLLLRKLECPVVSSLSEAMNIIL